MAEAARGDLGGRVAGAQEVPPGEGIAKPIPTSTGTRAVEPLDRVFMDASALKSVECVRNEDTRSDPAWFLAENLSLRKTRVLTISLRMMNLGVFPWW